MKKLLLILLTLTTLFAGDARLKNIPQAQEWEKSAKTDADSAYNLALIYQTKIKDFNQAISLYEHSFSLKKSKDVANNLGAAYEYIKDYDEAVKWYKIASDIGNSKAMLNLALLYKKAYEKGNMGGANGLGYLYDVQLKKPDEAIKWYKLAAKNGHSKAINNLSQLYYDLNNKVEATAYALATINYGYTEKETLDFLKNDWKIDRPTLEKAYKLQQTLDIPKHYTGGID